MFCVCSIQNALLIKHTFYHTRENTITCIIAAVQAAASSEVDDARIGLINDNVVKFHEFFGLKYFRLGGAVVRALDLRLEVAGSITAAALSSATLDKLFTHIVQRLWCYDLMALYKSV